MQLSSQTLTAIISKITLTFKKYNKINWKLNKKDTPEFKKFIYDFL